MNPHLSARYDGYALHSSPRDQLSAVDSASLVPGCVVGLNVYRPNALLIDQLGQRCRGSARGDPYFWRQQGHTIQFITFLSPISLDNAWSLQPYDE